MGASSSRGIFGQPRVTGASSKSGEEEEEEGVPGSWKDANALASNAKTVEEECVICRESFGDQAVAAPSTCAHCFCLNCLTEWIKRTNTCPVDRRVFYSMNVRPTFRDKVTHQIDVDIKAYDDDDDDDDGDDDLRDSFDHFDNDDDDSIDSDDSGDNDDDDDEDEDENDTDDNEDEDKDEDDNSEIDWAEEAWAYKYEMDRRFSLVFTL